MLTRPYCKPAFIKIGKISRGLPWAGFIADVRPIDSRWFSFALDMDGMTWGCARSLRSKADIEREYQIAISSKKRYRP
jgi:hypothetical protein